MLREDDVGITFNKIEDIRYCPVCGKKLLSFKEKLRHYDENDNHLCDLKAASDEITKKG